MNTKPKLQPLVRQLVALGLIGFAGAAFAADDTLSRIERLESQLKALQSELSRLKAESGGGATQAGATLGELKTQVELNHKEVVVGGDIGGSFRLPGSETSVRLYGYAEAHALKDFARTARGDDFSNVAELPTSAASTNGKSKLTVQTSRFGIETATPTASGSFNTKIEADFYSYCNGTFYNNGAQDANGNNTSRDDANDCNRNRLRLRHAYGEYAGFLVGQTWSTWMDLDNQPETIDFNGPIGAPFQRIPMIRYTYNLPDIAKLTAALEDPHAWGAASVTKPYITQNRPNVVLRVDKSFDWGALTARFMSTNIRYDRYSSNNKGWGIGGSVKVTDTDTFTAQYNSLKGDYNGQYMVGANGIDADSSTGKFYTDKSTGLIVGWMHTFDSQWRGNLAYSETRAHENQEYLDWYGGNVDAGTLPNRKLTQYHINLIYTPIKNIDLGIEYLGGSRTTYGDANGKDGKGKMRRLDLMGRYSF